MIFDLCLPKHPVRDVDFFFRSQIILNMCKVRSKMLALLLSLFFTTMGFALISHCYCSLADSVCEHAGKPCAIPDDCTDCLVPSDNIAEPGVPAAIFSSFRAQICSPGWAVLFNYNEVYLFEVSFVPSAKFGSSTRPLALHAGTLCLRI